MFILKKIVRKVLPELRVLEALGLLEQKKISKYLTLRDL